MCLPMLLVTRVWQLALWGGLMFFFLGGLDPVMKVMITRRVPQERRGALFGLMGSARAVGMGLGSISGGATAAAFGLRSVYVVSAALLVVVAVLVASLRRTMTSPAAGAPADNPTD